jgi:gliding motility-associated-like protein
MNRVLFLFVLNILFLGDNFATHLVGGNLAYEFIGVQPNGDFRYTIKLNYYFDCGTNSNWQPPNIPTNMSVGVYAHDDPTDIYPTTTGTYPKYGTSDVDMVYNSTVQEYFEINPNNPSGCSVGLSTCVYTVLYTGEIDLAPTNPSTGQQVIGGYFLIHEACCRNGGGNGIDNIQSPGSAGMAFYAYIPPYGYENNSPTFTDNPVPFICSGDTTTFLNTAIDPDGDELVFSFTAPLDGNHAGGFGGANNVGSGGPGPGASLTWYPNSYPWPIEKVTYAGGYSYQQPFGPGGYYYISASNGLTKYKSNNQGKYVVGLMIKEYRNGTLIGISTREVQLNIIACPPNSAPNINPSAGSTNTIFSIEEGGNLSFNFGFFDPDIPIDSLTLNVSGQIFDSTFTSPEAQVGGYYDTLYSDPVNGVDTVGTTFTWSTGCGQAQLLPYFFSASVSDRGCPPKTTSVVYEVTVNKTDPPANIYGSLIECQNAEAVYTTDDNPNISGYTWDVSANGIITQNYGDSAKILWTAPGTGSVFLKAVNQFGCESDPILINTTITPAPIVDAGSDVSICLGDSVLLSGTTTALPGYISLWQPNTNISNPTNLSTWVNPTVTTSYYLLVQRGTSCIGGDSVKVIVDIGNIDAGNDISICLGDTVSLTASGTGSNFSWTPNTSISQTNTASAQVWPTITTQYNVQFTSSNNCQAEDSVVVFVNPTPGSSPNFTLNGSATSLGNNTYQMTTTINNDFASIWNSSMLNLNQAFQINAELNFGTKDATGADGMAFVLQQSSTSYAPTLGNADFAIIDPSLIVEFDTWNNQNYNDINDDHIAILKDGSSDHNVNSLLNPISLGNIEDGNWHTTTINWDPLAQNLTIDFDGVQVAILNYDIVQNIFNNNSAVYWGFTATTGGSNNNQSVRFSNTTTFNPINDLVICETDTVTIDSPVSTNSYLWSPNVSINDNTIESPDFNPLITTTYYFTGTNSFGCLVKDTFQITVNNLPAVNAGNDQIVCDGDSATLNASGNALNFAWDNSIVNGQIFEVINTQNYILTGTSSDGCINKDTVLINALNSPSTDAGSDINLCINDSVQLQASGADNYLWTPNTFLSASNISNPWAVPAVNTTYILTGSLANGCTKNDTISIDINPLPLLTTSIDATICEGDTIQIEVFGGSSCTWLTVNNLSNSTVSNPLVWPTSTTTYTVLASDNNTCADTAEVTITVNPKPNINAGIDQNICFGDSTSLNASGNAVIYNWSDGITNGVLFESILTQEYILTGTGINNCNNQDTVTVNTLNLPIIDAGQDETICIGDSIQLQVTGANNYLWTPNDYINSNTISNPIVYPTNLTDYIVSGTDSNNCFNQDTIQILVNDLPIIVTSNDESICIGDSIIISATGGASYLWLNQDSISNINISNPEIWPSSNSTYEVIVTGFNNCIDTAEINIQVNSLPTIDAGNNQNICSGDTAQISVFGAINYQWSPNINISSSNTSTINAWPENTTNYIVSGIDANFCISKDTVKINILNLPIADAGKDLWLCPGGSLTLSATGGTTYNWFPDSTLSSSIGTPTANPFDDETYIVEVIDSNNCINYDTTFLKVESDVPTDAGGDTLTICSFTNVVLGGNPTAPAGSFYIWSSNSNITGPTNSNPISKPSSPSWYTVETTNDTCSGIDSVFVEFFRDFIGNSSIDTSICFGENTTLSVSGGSSYIWSPITNSQGDTILENKFSANPIIFPSETTTFKVSIFDTNGCYIIDSTIIDIKQLPTLDLGADLFYCINDSIELSSPFHQNYTYSWSPNFAISNTSIYNPSVYSTTDTNYILALTDTLNCTNYDTIGVSINSLPNVNISGIDSLCFGDSTILNASGSALVTSYNWSPNTNLSNNSIFNPVAFPDSSYSYFVTSTDINGCSNMDSLFITVISLPIANAGEDTAICPGGSLQLNGSGGNIPEWINATTLSDPNIYNPISSTSTSTNYILKVTDTFGCINFDTILVDVFANVVADAGADIDTCANVPVPLKASGGVSYFWLDSLYINRPYVSNPLAFPNDDIEFIVEVTDSNGCVGYDSVNVFIFLANASNDTLICDGDSYQANIYGDSPSAVFWLPVDGVSNPNIGNPILSPTETTTYLVNIIDGARCNITDTVKIEVPMIKATFDTVIEPGCNEIEITYYNTSNTELNTSWIFSDSNIPINNENEIVKTFSFDSDYFGSLFVQDSNGCIDSLTYNGIVLNFDEWLGEIREPNVFTPNGDNMNDEFTIEIPKKVEKCAELTIYNRWGQIIYFSTGNNLKWDGKNSVGSESPTGTYFYTLTIKDEKFDGKLNLLR